MEGHVHDKSQVRPRQFLVWWIKILQVVLYGIYQSFPNPHLFFSFAQRLRSKGKCATVLDPFNRSILFPTALKSLHIQYCHWMSWVVGMCWERGSASITGGELVKDKVGEETGNTKISFANQKHAKSPTWWPKKNTIPGNVIFYQVKYTFNT